MYFCVSTFFFFLMFLYIFFWDSWHNSYWTWQRYIVYRYFCRDKPFVLLLTRAMHNIFKRWGFDKNINYFYSTQYIKIWPCLSVYPVLRQLKWYKCVFLWLSYYHILHTLRMARFLIFTMLGLMRYQWTVSYHDVQINGRLHTSDKLIANIMKLRITTYILPLNISFWEGLMSEWVSRYNLWIYRNSERMNVFIKGTWGKILRKPPHTRCWEKYNSFSFPA